MTIETTRNHIKLMNIKRIIRDALAATAIACTAASCSTPKNIAYFQDAQDAQVIEILSEGKQITVQPHDKLSIIVSSKDPNLSQLFNLNVIANRTGQGDSFNGTGAEIREYSLATSEGISTFTVSDQGTIDYPLLGELKIEGMTRNELSAFIKGEIMGKNLIKDPIVTVEFLNTGVSVLGEVNKPGRFDMNSDIITLPEALALAGDLTIQGQRENVTVLRRDGNKVETYRVDITKTKDMIQSPAFYLKQGDVVYVEPNGVRKRQTTANGNNLSNLSFWISVASLITTAAVLIK